jgi:hypothetical protein
VDRVLAHTLHTETALEVWERLASIGSHKLILDIDDAMWRPDFGPFREHYGPDVLARLYRAVALSHVVTVPTAPLAEHLSRHNRNVWIVPNTVPAWLLEYTMPERDRPTLGYQGSPSHAGDWTQPQVRQLARFLHHHPEWGMQWMGADPGPLMRARPGISHVSWRAPGEDYYRAVSFDVGIGPLADTYFNRAKSGLRAIEYAALGIVAVLPDAPAYRGWIEDGVTGRLIRSHQTLSGVLAAVAADDEHRVKMSTTARERAAAWTTEAAIGSWIEAWDSQ